jgi:tetratricopeptide (TPR) repeat protein
MMYWAHGLPTEALSCLKEAARLAPETFRWRYYIAVLHEQIDLDLADRDYEAAGRLDPSYAPLLCRHADLLTRLDRADAAEVKYREAARLAPDSPYPHVALGRLAVSRQDLPEAARHLAAAVEVAPWSRDAHFEYGHVFRRLRDVAGSDREFERGGKLPEIRTEMSDPLRDEVIELDRTSRPLAAEADRAVGRGDLEKAIGLLHRLIDERPDLARPRLNLGQLLQAQGQRQAAVVVLREAVEEFPQEPLARFAYAQALEGVGEAEAAMEAYRHAGALKPDYLDAHLELGRLLLQRGEPSAAVLALRSAVSAEPGSAKAHRALGECLSALGDEVGARQQFEVALRLEPRWVELRERLDARTDERINTEEDRTPSR